MALGAGRGRVLRLFVGRGMALLVAAGIVLGLVAAFAGARWIAALLYGMETGNLVAFTAAALALAAVALAATWLPARRAAAMRPPPLPNQRTFSLGIWVPLK